MTLGNIIYKETKYNHNYINKKINEYIEIIDSIGNEDLTYVLFMNRTPDLLIVIIALLLRKRDLQF